MDGKVNLPRLLADVNWQGPEDLHGMNESIYEHRRNYRLSLADWTNYLKDVDRVFALLNSHHEQNKTNQTKSAPSGGVSAVSAELSVPAEMASAESGADPSRAVGGAPHLTLPADLRTLHLNRPTFSPENKLEWNNDIPGVNRLDPEHWRNHKTDGWMEREETNPLESDFSGNGVAGLAPEPHPGLQPRKERPRDGGPGEDVFEDRLYLPVRSDVGPRHRTVQASTLEEPVHSSSTDGVCDEVEEHPGSGTF